MSAWKTRDATMWNPGTTSSIGHSPAAYSHFPSSPACFLHFPWHIWGMCSVVGVRVFTGCSPVWLLPLSVQSYPLSVSSIWDVLISNNITQSSCVNPVIMTECIKLHLARRLGSQAFPAGSSGKCPCGENHTTKNNTEISGNWVDFSQERAMSWGCSSVLMGLSAMY